MAVCVQTAIETDDIELTTIIQGLFKKSHVTYGTRRLQKSLLNRDRVVSRRRIGRLMREAELVCKTKRKFKATTNSKHDQPIAPNHLDRQFTVNQPNQVYAGDITHIHTQAVVIDLYSRQVVGWSMAEHMRTKLVNDALLMVIWKRKPGKDLLWHSDRGSQYASESHRVLLAQHGIRQSMSRKGNCWANSVSESFFHILKTELIHHQTYQTRAEARQAVFEYIEVFYNRERLSIQQMAIYRQLTMNCSTKLLNRVSGKVLTDQLCPVQFFLKHVFKKLYFLLPHKPAMCSCWLDLSSYFPVGKCNVLLVSVSAASCRASDRVG
ncbi:MAG: IS3 family transposase [Methylobacter sp.]|nr:IS3 family transposase [Methylobacter sp.]